MQAAHSRSNPLVVVIKAPGFEQEWLDPLLWDGCCGRAGTNAPGVKESAS